MQPLPVGCRLACQSSTVALLVALGGCKPQESTEPPPIPRSSAPAVEVDPIEELRAEIRETIDLLETPGLAIAVVYRGDVVLAEGFGVKEIGKKDPVDENTVFAIASNTKAFVATTVGLLVADGTLHWDDRVREHLPELRLWDEVTTEKMRVRDLLTHRSGLGTWAGDLMAIGSKVSTEDLVQRLRYLPAEHDLRERYGYSNLMYVLAGRVIEEKTGKPWHAVVAERLLGPLGMERTVASVDALESMDNVATPHMKVDGELVTIPYLKIDNAGAAGALNSSVSDMSKWLQLQLAKGEFDGERFVPRSIIETTREPHTIMPRGSAGEPHRGHLTAYGLGWVLFDYGGELVVTHSGGLPGMISRVLLVPEAELGVVVLTNAETSAASLVAMLAVDRILGLQPPDRVGEVLTRQAEQERAKEVPEPPEEAEPALAIERYAGDYESSLLGRATVRRDGETLTLDVVDHGNLRCRLEPLGDNVFGCTWSDPIFERSKIHFDVEGERVQALRFKVRPTWIDPLEYRFEPARSRPRRKRN